MLQNVLGIIQAAAAVMLIAAILLQAQGAGLGASFGGEGNVYRTKRGVEKILFTATIFLSIVFFGVALLNVVF